MKILTVVGARPQFVKAAVVSRAVLRARAAGGPAIEEEIVHTGQHYDHGMSEVFFEQMDIPRPVVDLAVGSGRHGETTGAMLAGIEREILARSPDVVLVYGDTNSTLAAALAAAKLHVPVAHVEAGLRSFNRAMPEEVNRVLTDHVSQWLFCPSEVSKKHLANEGIHDGVRVVGDVMADAVEHYRQKAIAPSIDGPFALATLHRAENTDEPERLRGIVAALEGSDIPVVLPLHPRTAATFERLGISPQGSLRIVEPVSYFEMLGLLEAARFVLTDSGGLQKEAFWFGKRCVTMRDETEWVELVEIGANRVVGSSEQAIRDAIAWADAPVTDAPAVYGDGTAGDVIVRELRA